MVKVIIFKNSTDSGSTMYTGIMMEGHARYAGEDEDIICAATSTLTLNFFNLVEALTGNGLKGGTEENGSFEFRFTLETSPESEFLMDSLILEFQNIGRDYEKSYINVKFKEVQHMLKMNFQLFARKKGISPTKGGGGSGAKRLSVGRADGQFVLADNILYRQCGTHIHPGSNVGGGGNDTLSALVNGVVKFERKSRDRK